MTRSSEPAAPRGGRGGVRVPEGYPPPVVIGGIGGSGTRVAAGMLRELGFYIGEDLNAALDNLSYTFLLKRPRWYTRASTRQRRVDAGARVLVASMTTGRPRGPRELTTVLGALAGTIPRGHDRLGRRRGLRWAPGAARRLLASGGHNPSRVPGWGWKEPNSIMLLEELDAALPGMRFIHVLRDPEQLARGKNQTMVYNWSELAGLEPPRRGAADLPQRSLEFARVVTERAERVGRGRLGARYHQLDMNRLCDRPEPELDPLLEFLGVRADAEMRARLCAIPDARRLAGSPSG